MLLSGTSEVAHVSESQDTDTGGLVESSASGKSLEPANPDKHLSRAAIPSPPPYSTDMGAVALVVSMLLFIVVSLVDKPAAIDPDVELVMEL